MRTMKLTLFGPPRLEQDGQPVDVSRRKALALLVYLAATGTWPEVRVPISTPMMLVGGFIVGMGVTLGSGCTSGHGVCGMARLSPRSISATLTFMATTAITVFIVRHVVGG